MNSNSSFRTANSGSQSVPQSIESANNASQQLALPTTAPQPSAPPIDDFIFKSENVFCLMGHGSYNSTEPKLYELKPNEFYAHSTKCGYVSIFPNNYFDYFIFNRPYIYIPTPFLPSYQTLNNSPIFKRTQQLYENRYQNRLQNNINTIHIDISSEAYKMYVPFSHKKRSKTITNDNYAYFSFFEIKSKDFTHPTNSVINYQGVEHNFIKDNYSIYAITWSGIVSSYQIEKYNAISNQLQEFANINSMLIDSFKIIDKYVITLLLPFTFVTVIPNEIKNVKYATMYNMKDRILPLFKSFFDLLDTMSSLSIIPINEFSTDYENATVMGIFNMSRTIKDVYSMIQTKRQTEDPILLINPLCRVKTNSSKNNTNQLQYESNNNTNIRSIRKTRKHTYNRLKQRAKQLYRTRGLRNTLKNLYGPTYKHVINKSTVSNLTGLSPNNVSSYINRLPEGEINWNTLESTPPPKNNRPKAMIVPLNNNYNVMPKASQSNS